MYSFPHFSTTPITYSVDVTDVYVSESYYTSTFANWHDSDSLFFKGFMHSAYLKPGYLSITEITSTYLAPRGSGYAA